MAGLTDALRIIREELPKFATETGIPFFGKDEPRSVMREPSSRQREKDTLENIAALGLGALPVAKGAKLAYGALSKIPGALPAAAVAITGDPTAALPGKIGGADALMSLANMGGVKDAEAALMFHASPNWWKDLRFLNEFLKSGEGQTVKGLGHYTTGSPSHAWERYNVGLGGDNTTQGVALGPLTAASLPDARREFVKAMRDASQLEERLATIRAANPNISDEEVNTIRNAAEDVFGMALKRAELKMQAAEKERSMIPQRPNSAQGNILTVNTKRPFSEYVNWAGDVSSDQVNADKLWKVVKNNPHAAAVYDSNVVDSWGDMIKGLEDRFGEQNAAKILSSAGIAGNLHPNMLSKKYGGLESLSARGIGRAVERGTLSPEHFNASTINPEDLEVLKRYKSLESLESDLPNYGSYGWGE